MRIDFDSLDVDLVSISELQEVLVDLTNDLHMIYASRDRILKDIIACSNLLKEKEKKNEKI